MPDLDVLPAGGAIAGHPRLDVTVPEGVLRWLEGGIVTVNVGFDLDFEGRHLAAARRAERQWLSIRLRSRGVIIGPRFVPGQAGSCAGCAEARVRQAVDHPLVARGDVNTEARGGWPAVLAVLAEVGLNHLASHPLAPDEVLELGIGATKRRRVVRSIACPLCGPVRGRTSSPDAAPPPLALESRPSCDPVPVRGPRNPAIDGGGLERLVDARVGPIVHLARNGTTPFAMTSAVVPAARSFGHGRAGHFSRAGRVAILEAYERMGDFPHEAAIFRDLSYHDLGNGAVDPATLGRYSPAQLAHPNCRVAPYDPARPMDWAYGYRLGDGAPRLLPADVAFYAYDYQHRLDYHTARRNRRMQRRSHFFAESSNGCALGSSLEEAALHGLIEVIERDAFLLAWCRRQPLTAIAGWTVSDPTTRMLIESIEARGFDVHLLVTTVDLGLPAVWAMAVNRDASAVPATYSAAGASPSPADAVRAAVWELAQLAAQPVDWDRTAAERLAEDPSGVDSIEDHVHLAALPAWRDRVTAVLGGPTLTLPEAFPGWPETLVRAAGGDVRGALLFLVDGCRRAGLGEVYVVDASTAEHRELGLRVVRVVVPGALPMCFGSPQQRLAGLPRREAALALAGRTTAEADAELLLDPHPFP